MLGTILAVLSVNGGVLLLLKLMIGGKPKDEMKIGIAFLAIQAILGVALLVLLLNKTVTNWELLGYQAVGIALTAMVLCLERLGWFSTPITNVPPRVDYHGVDWNDTLDVE